MAPKDPPPPRRSRRGTLPDTEAERVPTTTRKGAKTKAVDIRSSIFGQEDGNHSWEPKSDDGDDQLEEIFHEETAGKQRKRVMRNVGGWISPEFAQKIDRNWLDKDASSKQFDLRSYVPQVGELVLYFITGHKQYLEVNPDIIGKKTRSKMRIPLWERYVDIAIEYDVTLPCSLMVQSSEATR